MSDPTTPDSDELREDDLDAVGGGIGGLFPSAGSTGSINTGSNSAGS